MNAMCECETISKRSKRERERKKAGRENPMI